MRVLGMTRSRKAINDNDGLDLDGIFNLYKDFTFDDHYDAASLWLVNDDLDYTVHYTNREFHLANIGMMYIDLDFKKKHEMLVHGRTLKKKEKSYVGLHAANRQSNSTNS